jgi:hypothetical protein
MSDEIKGQGSLIAGRIVAIEALKNNLSHLENCIAGLVGEIFARRRSPKQAF